MNAQQQPSRINEDDPRPIRFNGRVGGAMIALCLMAIIVTLIIVTKY